MRRIPLLPVPSGQNGRRTGSTLETGILKTEVTLNLSGRHLTQSSDWLCDERLKLYSLHSTVIVLSSTPKFGLELPQHNQRIPWALFPRIKLEDSKAHLSH